MTKKKVLLFTVMVACLALWLSIAVFAANEPVTYKVSTAGGIMERNTTVGVLFNISTSGKNRIINGINSTVEGFASNKIVEVHVPYGITEVNITNIENTSVQTIVFDSYCQAKVTSLKGLTGLKTISVAGIEAQLSFGTSCVNNGLEVFSVTAPRATIEFSEKAFGGITTLKRLELGKSLDPQKPSSFKFGKNCFQNTAIEELLLDDDYATYTFSGEGAFSNNAKLKQVYLGENATSMGITTFDYCINLEFVYAKGLKAIPDNSFRVMANSDRKVLKLYIHTQGRVTVGTNAFSGRKAKGVVVCALETSATAFTDCKYELHYGVPHLYQPSSEDPTCYTSYVTDCACGRVGNAYYKLYKSSSSAVETVKLVAGPNPEIPHTFTGAYRLEYENGIENVGVVELKCAVCGTLEGKERKAAPVVEFLGYSVAESGDRAMISGVRFNYTTLKQYGEINGAELEYGLVMAAKSAIGENSPITESGEAYSNSVYLLNMSKTGLYESTIKLSNIKDTMVDTELVFSAYIKIGKEIIYFQGNGEAKVPTSVTYSQLIK